MGRHGLRWINQQERVTIILTTHDMDDIEELCERIIFINVGNIIYDGPLQTLKSRYATHKEIEISYERPVAVPAAYAPLLLEQDRSSCTFRVPRPEVAAMVPRLLELGRARDVTIHEPRLEDVVKIIYSTATDQIESWGIRWYGNIASANSIPTKPG